MIPMIASAVGSGIQMVSTLQAGKAAELAGEVANANAQTRARQAESEGLERGRRLSSNNRQRMSAIRARMAASGVQMTGSSSDTLGATASRLELRVQDVAYQASTDAMAERYSGAVSRFEGRQARSASYLGAAGHLAGGVYDASSAMNKMKKTPPAAAAGAVG